MVCEIFDDGGVNAGRLGSDLEAIYARISIKLYDQEHRKFRSI